jgi:hypothetical protein
MTPDPPDEARTPVAAPWRVRGDFVISCNCEVFCPCVLSLGRARPSAGDCHSWFAFRIAEGHAGECRLDGRRVAFMLEVPGPMAEGNWRLGLYLDPEASDPAADALSAIFTGRAGGPLGWFTLVVAEILGVRRVPITLEREGRGWRFTIPAIADGQVEPIPGAAGDGLVRITNSRYWMAPDVTVCAARRSRLRDWGRNWTLDGRSAEYGAFDWAGP